MRPVASLAMFLLLASAHSVEAQWNPSLRIYSDQALTITSIEDNAPRIVKLYVVESGMLAATGVMFSTEPTAGFTGTWLGDESDYFFIGNSPTYINIAYGVCHPAPVLALRMTYQLFGTSSACSELRIVPPDGWSCVGAPDVNCSFVEACIRDAGSLLVNCPVPTEPTTWGKVKALYRN